MFVELTNKSVFMRVCQKFKAFKGRIKDKKFPMHFDEYLFLPFTGCFQVLFNFIQNHC